MRLKEIQSKFIDRVYKGEESSSLEEIITPAGKLNHRESLEVYAEDYEVRMLEALKENYEKVAERIGAETFYMLYCDFKKSHKSHSYDLGRYGDEFPEFIRNHPISLKRPHLHLLAQMDLAFREIFHSLLEPGLTAEELQGTSESSTLEFLKNLKAFHAPVPLWKADYTNERSFFLFRTEEGVNYFPISKNQYTLFLNLQRGQPLSEAIGTLKDIAAEEVQELFEFLSVNRLIKSLK